MLVTIITTIMMMVAYFLLLYGGVAFIQDKKFFSSAPKEILNAVPKEKRGFMVLILLAGSSLLSQF